MSGCRSPRRSCCSHWRRWLRSAGLGWQGTREHRGALFIGAGIAALAAYGIVATLQDDNNFGRILAAYCGIVVAGSLGWGMVADGFRPDRFDLAGALLRLVVCRPIGGA